VAERAYFIYLSEGCPCGDDQQHWFQAEAQLLAETQSADASPPPELI
jgi:hypothetical protein